ncbi:Crp/Fnr family transcriptional regulator [Paucibacter soli]|uniref:Crp/Fnr family transcriptional regulator n=1 Tax=Paucibacter soli TaxID=3133433 RepID=UPI00309CADE8
MYAAAFSLHRQGRTHPQALACASCELRRLALFGTLTEQALDCIHVHIAAQRLEAGQTLYDIGQHAEALFTVRAGVVRLERVNASGERRVVRLAGRGDLIGLEALLKQPYGSSALASTALEVCRIPRGLVAELSQSHVGLATELMQRWQQALAQAEEWLAELSMGPARRRVLRLVHKLSQYAQSEEPQPWIWLPTRGDIGAMLNMSMETASRAISALRRQGVLLQVEPQRARLDLAALRARLRSDE